MTLDISANISFILIPYIDDYDIASHLKHYLIKAKNIDQTWVIEKNKHEFLFHLVATTTGLVAS